MPTIGWDQQISAVRDDNTPQGLLRAEIAHGNLVMVPLRKGMFLATSNGASSQDSFGGLATNNNDGTQTGCVVDVPPSATLANSCVIQFWMMGNVLGLRWDQNYGTQPSFAVLVDRVAYPVTTGNAKDPTAQTNIALVSGEFAQIISRDLGDGPHFVEVVFPCATSGSNRRTMLYGFIADAAAGYQPMPRGVHLRAAPNVTAAVPASATAAIFGNLTCYGVRKLFFYNPTAGALTVNLNYVAKPIFWSKSVAPGDTVEFDFGAPFYDYPNLQFSASNTGLVASMLGVL